MTSRPDDNMTEELRGLSAGLNRVGNNVNQVARRLNEAKLKGERLPHTPAGHAENRGITIQHIQTGQPLQYAYIERYNRTVRPEWLDQ